MTLPLLTPSPEADVERRRALRRMRGVALSLLIAAAVVYVATLGSDGWLGYVNAFAEASMVGAIADWFAVTALFRHPLGIPIPHTALIPRRKDDLGRGLEEFMGENFLQESVIRERVAAANITSRVATWVGEPQNARRVVDEATDVAAIGLRRVQDRHITELVEDVLVPRFREEPISPVLGTFLVEAVRDDLHHGVVDLAVEELHGWLLAHPDEFTEVLAERAPWWAPPKLNEAVTTRIHLEAVRWLADIRADPDHRARQALDSMLGQLGQDLLFNAETQERAENFKLRLLSHPQMAATTVSLWKALRNALLEGLRHEDGPLKQRLVDELMALAGRLRVDDDLRGRADQALSDFIVFAVDRYGSELTSVITQTIGRWDGEEAAQKIELHVGRDLQFIRINGTVVGGLVGLTIHTISQLIH